MLRELLALDVEYRCRRGDQPLVAEYASRFPDYEETIDAEFLRRTAEAESPSEETISSAPLPHSTTPPLTGVSPGDSLQHYTVLQELGHGGFGTVFLRVTRRCSGRWRSKFRAEIASNQTKS